MKTRWSPELQDVPLQVWTRVALTAAGMARTRAITVTMGAIFDGVFEALGLCDWKLEVWGDRLKALEWVRVVSLGGWRGSYMSLETTQRTCRAHAFPFQPLIKILYNFIRPTSFHRLNVLASPARQGTQTINTTSTTGTSYEYRALAGVFRSMLLTLCAYFPKGKMRQFFVCKVR